MSHNKLHSQISRKTAQQDFHHNNIEEQAQGEKVPVITSFSKNSTQLLKPSNILALQRIIGNRAVNRMLADRKGGNQVSSRPIAYGQLVVQRTPAENAQILASVPGTAPDGTYKSEGSKGDEIKLATDDFITGESGTWHHIYPRNLLGKHLGSISKYFVATSGKEGQLTTTGTTSHQQMLLMAATLPMDTTGKLSKPARYYWKKGNGFAGIRSDYRTDDPGSLVEHGKPPSMSKDKYQLPRNWGKELEKMAAALEDLAGTTIDKVSSVDGNLSKIAANVVSFSQQLDDATPYRTVSAREGKDWIRKDSAGTKPWGAKVKNYKMVT